MSDEEPCWCEWCQGRRGEHGPAAVALYHARVVSSRRKRSRCVGVTVDVSYYGGKYLVSSGWLTKTGIEWRSEGPPLPLDQAFAWARCVLVTYT